MNEPIIRFLRRKLAQPTAMDYFMEFLKYLESNLE